MAYYLSNLLQDAYRALGKTETLVLTGGSTTTVIDTKLESKYKDDELKNWTCFVTRDAGGASAAPENEFQRISGYVESTNVATVDTAFTIAPASGDIVTICNDQFPLLETIEQATIALQYLGDVLAVDTSITTADSQTEYTLPVALKRDALVRVEYQSITTDANDNQWQIIPRDQYTIVPAAPGSTGLLILPQFPSGHIIKIWYVGLHPKLTAYNSVVSESIHPNVAKASLVAHALQWYNNMAAGSDDFMMQRENMAWREMEIALVKHPINIEQKKNKVLTVGSVVEPDVFTYPEPA